LRTADSNDVISITVRGISNAPSSTFVKDGGVVSAKLLPGDYLITVPDKIGSASVYTLSVNKQASASIIMKPERILPWNW
jgi:hypothetical protein